MKVNAAPIYNAITTRLPLLTAKVESKVINKWLVPTAPHFLLEQEKCQIPREQIVRYYFYKYPDSDTSEIYKKYHYNPNETYSGSSSLRMSDLDVKLFIDITKPGPQYLLYLEFRGEYAQAPSSPLVQLTCPACKLSFGLLIWATDQD
jgi:hypothetical protein